MAENRDTTHVVPSDFDIDKSNISPEIEKIANYIRTKAYGVDVRESIALAIELIAGGNADGLSGEIKALRNIAYTISAGSDKGDSNVEVKTARININGNEYVSIGARFDSIERAIVRLGGTLDV